MVSAVPPVSHILPHCHCFFAENRGLKPGSDQLYTMSMLSVCTVLRDRELVFRGMGMGHRAQGIGHRAQSKGHGAKGTGHRAQGTEHRAWGKGHRAKGTGHRAWGKEQGAPARTFSKYRFVSARSGGWWDGGMWMGGWFDRLIV
jgi:hypothetical protein